MSRDSNSSSDRWLQAGLLLMRIAASSLLLTHGLPKLQTLMAGGEIRFLDFMGIGPAASLSLAVFGEVVAPVLVMLGFLTRWAAFPAAFTMLVAVVMVHGSDPLKEKELALLYLLPFAVLMLTGAGRWSIDGWRSQRSAGRLAR